MLFHFILNDLSVTLLNSLKVFLSILKLIFAIEYGGFGASNFLLDILHHLRNDFNLVVGQSLLVNALSTKQSVLV